MKKFRFTGTERRYTMKLSLKPSRQNRRDREQQLAQRLAVRQYRVER
jgi:hypothetical protein